MVLLLIFKSRHRVLLLHSSMVPGLIHILPVSLWVSSGFSSFLPISVKRAGKWIGYAKLPLVQCERMCVCMVPWDGLVSLDPLQP